jgi:hypothetical protein
MAVASSLATTLSLVPLRQASFSDSSKPSLLSFSLLFPILSLRASRAPSPRLCAIPPDSDEFEPEEDVDEEDFPVPPPGGFDALTGFEGDGVEDDEEDYEEGDEATEAESTTMEVCSFLIFFSRTPCFFLFPLLY